jgi:hypothetical protein
MSEGEFQALIENVSATAIANQAVLKCFLRGVPVTTDNVLLFVGDFFDPADDVFSGVAEKILEALEYIADDTLD